ncbi:unnamed protein product [Heligmosomoides polygyrus]|uniref:DNK domain-containing protein n=1 Tax=Heligmosomoides polygyrus TaxID=6339 RepID=A0A3P8DC73_HELPZ|nr:unnamed protein product [Heligmosomoides polygyrus]
MHTKSDVYHKKAHLADAVGDVLRKYSRQKMLPCLKKRPQNVCSTLVISPKRKFPEVHRHLVPDFSPDHRIWNYPSSVRLPASTAMSDWMNASRSRSPRTIEEEEGWKWAGVYRKSDLGAVSEMSQMESFGLSFKRDCKSIDDLLKWQSVQFRLQIEQEEIMKFAAYKYEFKNPVILIDRALPSIYTNKEQYSILERKTSLVNLIPFVRYDGVIYIRTITDEERDLSLSEGSTRADRQENLDTVRKLCAKNEEMWSQHKKFVLVETGSGDKFRRRVELAAVALSGLLKFKLQPG